MFKRASLIFVFLMSLILFGTCSKKNEQNTVKDENNNDVQLVNVDDKDLNESDKDLKDVNYKDIYDELSSKGKWVQVSGKEIGIDTKMGTAAADRDFQKSILSFISGVKDAYAEENVDVGMFFVWQPSPDLAVSLSSDNVQPAYVPYTNGQWINTDAGWYFQAPTPEEEIVHHYGRWAYSDDVGWVWVPGRVWSPAWVDWRENDDLNYIAWAPVPPSVYVVNNEFYVPPIPYDRYYIVDESHFIDPEVYRYQTFVDNQVIINNWSRPTGIFVENQTIINRGPDVTVIEKYSGRTIEQVKIQHVRDIGDIKYSEKDKIIRTYTPEFKKVKSDQKVNKVVSQPKSFAKYDEVKKNSPLANKNDNNSKNKQENMNNPQKDGKSGMDKTHQANPQNKDNHVNKSPDKNTGKQNFNKNKSQKNGDPQLGNNKGNYNSKKRDNNKGTDKNSNVNENNLANQTTNPKFYNMKTFYVVIDSIKDCLSDIEKEFRSKNLH